MKRWLLVAAGGLAGLLVGLVLSLTVGAVLAKSYSLLLGAIVWACMVGGAFLGYKIGAPGPDPTTLRESRDYFQWLQDYRDAETGGTSTQESGDGKESR